MTPIPCRNIAVTTHGRYLLESAGRAAISPLLVGFHGYMEAAEDQMARLQSIPGSSQWRLVSIQALNRFYRGKRSQDIVASWLTRQDRDLAMADNQAYVAAVIAAIERESGPVPGIVFAGFSQGAGMAFRAACAAGARSLGVIALGYDVPPELGRAELGLLPAVLLGRGAHDELYSAAQWDADRARLVGAMPEGAAIRVDAFSFDAGHEWTTVFSERAGRLLASIAR